MADPTTPGWHPDPERSGMLRWWNGLGWSDARRAADQERAAIRPVAEDDARRGAGLLEAARRTAEAPGPISRRAVLDSARTARAAGGAATAGAAASVGALNPLAIGGVVLGLVGLTLGLWGAASVVGLIVSLAGLVRARRLAREGERRTGLPQSLGGLFLSVLGLVRWAPVVLAVLQDRGVVS